MPLLVDYESSSDSAGEDDIPKADPSPLVRRTANINNSLPKSKRRKLSGFGVSSSSSPSSTPSEVPPSAKPKTLKPGQLEGDWLCHAFIKVPISNDLRECLDPIINALSSLQDLEVTTSGETTSELDSKLKRENNSLKGGPQSAPSELHISLTRPILIRAHERNEFRTLVENALEGRNRFQIHFARLTTLINDDASRLFFVLEVGTGWEELHNLSTALNKPLHAAFRARSYYTEARYHASIASIPLPPSNNTITQAEAEAQAHKLDDLHARAFSRCPAFVAETVGIRVGAQLSTITLL
ncbi:unnamed protein product [Tilletia laevis]|uniref:U6 snRNA phosphodiesterase 1 n=2 Tax=Tilletia TaxID=13289 RepID=A0A177UHW7_9BASI|nr:hypothetical protein CF336_g8182 [Tilletia laevis]KAE8193128.1 hypothetical protein CF328_g5138 [Tilletia controversa]KAE8261548.1 hypothetical protein A4X03_0g3156 [Tilletia caries]KAE8185303.1 hypothetical protein CF335_g7762 [Tilletia laevis]CAD6889304.1 unnamed protein product [Tilletia caries]